MESAIIQDPKREDAWLFYLAFENGNDVAKSLSLLTRAQQAVDDVESLTSAYNEIK